MRPENCYFLKLPADIENRPVDTVGEERLGQVERAELKRGHDRVGHRQPVRMRRAARGAQTGRGARDRGEGWGGVGGRFGREGTRAPLWLIRVGVGQKPTQGCKAVILQLKQNEQLPGASHAQPGLRRTAQQPGATPPHSQDLLVWGALAVLLGFLLPWAWGISHGCSSKAQPLFLTLDEGYLLTAAFPDLHRGIAPLGPPAPAQPPLHGLQGDPTSPS